MSAVDTAPLIDHALQGRLDRLRLASRRPARGHLRGVHRAARLGAGLEFADYRAYRDGDPLDRVDWRAYLRLDRLLVRLFTEEADLPVHLLLDASRSMVTGSPSKFEFARRLAAALAHVALHALDRVSLVAIADGAARGLPNLRGLQRCEAAFAFLRALAPAGRTGLAAAIARHFSAPGRRGLCIVISDFLDPEGFALALSALRRRGHDVFVLHVVCADDARPAVGEVFLEDAEDGSRMLVEITPTVAAACAEAFTRHADALAAFCHRHGMGYHLAHSDDGVEATLFGGLRRTGLLA